MRSNTLTALLLATLCLAPGLVRAAQPPEWIQVEIKFDDNYVGAALKSDGGAYRTTTVRNQTQLSARINPSTGDLSLGFLDTPRVLNMKLSNIVYLPISACPVSPTPSPKHPAFTSDWFPTQQRLDVTSLLPVPVGSTVMTGVAIGLYDSGPYGRVLLGAWNVPTNFCSGRVFCTRVDEKTWVIESPARWDLIGGASPPYSDGIAVVNQDFATNPGRTDLRPVRYVNLPFKITVTALP